LLDLNDFTLVLGSNKTVINRFRWKMLFVNDFYKLSIMLSSNTALHFHLHLLLMLNVVIYDMIILGMLTLTLLKERCIQAK
jgi:hypothetical protein